MDSQSAPKLVDVPDPVVVVRENDHPGRGCVVVLGQPRGGTSVVAGLCHLIGVRMGRDIDPSNMEAREFLGLVKHEDFRARFESALDELKFGTQLFGFKDPAAVDYWQRVADLVPDPLFVVVFRDPVAIAERQRLDGADFAESLCQVGLRQSALVRLVAETKFPTAVVSYERLLGDTRRAYEQLSQFVTGSVSLRIAELVHEAVRPHADMPSEVNFLEIGARLSLVA